MDFSDRLRRICLGEHKHMTQRELAARLGVSPQTLNNWIGDRDRSGRLMEQTEPKLDAIERQLGLAEESHGVKEEHVTVYGKVSAGRASLAVEDQRRFKGPYGVFAKSLYRQYARGETVHLEVEGSSMEPEFPDGVILTCCHPNTQQLPDLTPVIARVGEEATFKLYRAGKDRHGKPEVELVPLNRTFPTQRYSPREVTIDYVVIGYSNPWTHGIFGNGTLLRGSGEPTQGADDLPDAKV